MGNPQAMAAAQKAMQNPKVCLRVCWCIMCVGMRVNVSHRARTRGGEYQRVHLTVSFTHIPPPPPPPARPPPPTHTQTHERLGGGCAGRHPAQPRQRC
jgi:hypothetical protein